MLGIVLLVAIGGGAIGFGAGRHDELWSQPVAPDTGAGWAPPVEKRLSNCLPPDLEGPDGKCLHDAYYFDSNGVRR